MKCPACGYHTFDHLQHCRKCGGDLTMSNSRQGLRGFFLSGGGRRGGKPSSHLPADESTLEVLPEFSTAGLEGDFPSSPEWPTGETWTVPPPAAPLAGRAAAMLADLVILGVVFIFFLVAGEIALGGTTPLSESFLDLIVPYFLVFFCLCFGYFTLFHFLLGQTPGKLLFGLRVTGSGGAPLLFTQAFLRSAGGLLSLLPAGIGFLLIFFDRQGRGWNDRLAGTRVIRLTDQPPG